MPEKGLRNRKLLVLSGGVLGVLLVLIVAFVFFKQPAAKPSEASPSAAPPESQPENTGVASADAKHNMLLPPGVEEPYCDCLADKLRPPEDWIPTRLSHSLWATQDLPTEEDFEKAQESRFSREKPTTSKEYLIKDLLTDNGHRPLDWYVTRWFREKVDITQQNLLPSRYYDYKTYYDRITFEYLGPNYYKGPIPGSRIEEAFMERYAVGEATNPKSFSPEFLAKSGGKSLAEAPEAYNPEEGLLWDQLAPDSQIMSGFDFDMARFGKVILLDYKLDANGRLTEFTFRPIGRREAFRVKIKNPIESFIFDSFWAGWQDYTEKNTNAMVKISKESESLLQDLIRYRQPVSISLNKSLIRKTHIGEGLISWRTHEEFMNLFDPVDNKIVVEATINKKNHPNAFVHVYYGGDFVFKLTPEAIQIPFSSHDVYPEILAEKIKQDPSAEEKLKKYEDEKVWAAKNDNLRPVYTYKYSRRDSLVALAPPFTGIKEYTGPIKHPFENDPVWKQDPERFSKEIGFTFYEGYY